MKFCRVGAVVSSMFLGTVTTALCIGAFISYVAIFVAFVATQGFLYIFLNFNSQVHNVDSVFNKVVSVFSGRADYLEVGVGLAWVSEFGLLDP